MQTTQFIPKEKRASYQRWELDSLDLPDSTNKPKIPDTMEPNVQNVEALPTEEQIASVYQQAKEEGYTTGYQTGREAGYQEGRQDAEAEVRTEVEEIQTLLSDLGRAIQQVDQEVAQDLLALALDLAKKMINQALQIRPELVLPIVQEAIRHLPSTGQHPRLFLHPDDATLVRNHLSDQVSQDNWEICEDEQIAKGGCRIETNGSEINAGLETRWQRVLATIGQEDHWLK